MAQLQCIDSIKKRSRTPSIAAVEATYSQAPSLQPRKACPSDHVFDIEVIAEEGHRVKIHYIGYDSSFDEWKTKEEIILRKPVGLTTDFHPLTELACQIKRKLYPSRHESPDVRIQIPTTNEAFDSLTSKATRKAKEYTLQRYQDLEGELGPKWFLRVINRNGDFHTPNLRL